MPGFEYDHGHVTMTDGQEFEFGYRPPTEVELAEHGGDLWDYAAEVALDWANADEQHTYTKDHIVRLRLAG